MGRFIQLIILFYLLASCSNTNQQSDPIVVVGDEETHIKEWHTIDHNPVSGEELLTLKSLLLFFDKVVKNRTGVLELDSAYHAYMENVRYKDSYMDIIDELAKDKAQVDSFLEADQNQILANRILRKDYFFSNREMTDTAGHIYNPNHINSYMVLLRDAAFMDSAFYGYGNNLQIFGSIPPNIVAGFQHHHPKLEFQNETIRLIVAIHYMSLH